MNLSKSVPDGFTPSELRLLGLLADQAAVAIFNASLHQTVEHAGIYGYRDRASPTGGRWMNALNRKSNSARRNGYTFAVIMMERGWVQTGQRLLRPYDRRLRIKRPFPVVLVTGVRSTDFLVRYGGDEFTLILSKTDPPATRLVMDKILKKIKNFSFQCTQWK